MRYAHIVGWGKHLPERVLTNQELETLVETTDEWIRTRTGIRERRIATAPKETTSTMAIRAAWEALRVANISPHHLDLIIVATTTPDHFFPSTACIVQDALGADRAGAFDLAAACSGFVYGLSIGRDAIASGSASAVLVIGAEMLSSFTDWQDRDTCVLFGDGAGAVVLQAQERPGGVLSAVLGSDGSGGDLLTLPSNSNGMHTPGATENGVVHPSYIKMDGRGVFRFAVRIMTKATREAVRKAGISLDDVNLIVPHQANKRIIEASLKSLKLDEDAAFINIDRYGNTSAASIPIALCEAVENGRVKPEDYLVFVGFGAGLTWAAAVIQWSGPRPIGGLLPIRYRLLNTLLHPWATFRSFLLRWRHRISAIIPGSPGDPYQSITEELPLPWAQNKSPESPQTNGNEPGDEDEAATDD